MDGIEGRWMASEWWMNEVDGGWMEWMESG